MNIETWKICCRAYFPNCEFLIGHGLNDGDLFVILNGSPIIRIRLFVLFYCSHVKEEEIIFTRADELQLNNILREVKHKLED